MLDSLERMEKIDKGNMRKLLLEFPLQCQEAVKLGESLAIPEKFLGGMTKVVVCGLGGSAIGGDILKTLLSEKLEIPIWVNRSYTLPRTVDKKTLIFIVSYSGNTEETLSAYNETIKRGILAISICSGGKLRQLSEKNKIPCLTVPSGMPPRTTVGYLFISMLKILERLRGIDEGDYEELFGVLSEIRDRFAPKVPLSKNPAKSLSQELRGKIPLIYGVEGLTDVVAHRMKTQLNENSKVLAFWNVFPELNHNEIVPWGREKEKADFRLKKAYPDFKQIYPSSKLFYLIFIRDKAEEKRIKKRIEVTQSIIKEKTKYTEIWTQGENPLTRILSAIYIGDWLSFYLAILQEIDPTPVKMIDLLKRELGKV